jgi:hypothetical protein
MFTEGDVVYEPDWKAGVVRDVHELVATVRWKDGVRDIPMDEIQLLFPANRGEELLDIAATTLTLRTIEGLFLWIDDLDARRSQLAIHFFSANPDPIVRQVVEQRRPDLADEFSSMLSIARPKVRREEPGPADDGFLDVVDDEPPPVHLKGSAQLVGQTILFSGSDPFEAEDLANLLPDNASWFTDEDALDQLSQDVAVEADLLVIGSNAFSADVIEAAIADAPAELIVLPQEGFLDLLLFGHDWWHVEIGVLNSFLDSHEGLAFAKSLATFEWPSIEAAESTGDSSAGQFRPETQLHRLGYQITDTTASQRWKTLVNRAVPEMGLQQVAETIAMLVRLRKSQRNGRTRYVNAIAAWEQDLDRLKTEFYPRYRHAFVWPTTEP